MLEEQKQCELQRDGESVLPCVNNKRMVGQLTFVKLHIW